MDFLAHFSFSEKRGGKRVYGHFTMIVSAATPQEALEKFKTGILRRREYYPDFNRTDKVFLDDIMVIKKMPKQAEIVSFDWISSGEEKLNEHFNPVDEKFVEIYKWAPDGKEKEYSMLGHIPKDPFLKFRLRLKRPI